MQVTQFAKQHAADDPRAAENQQQHGGKVAAQPGHGLDKGLNIAVGGVVGGDHYNGQQVDAHQRRATEKHR